jgi:hypothetical protein
MGKTVMGFAALVSALALSAWGCSSGSDGGGSGGAGTGGTGKGGSGGTASGGTAGTSTGGGDSGGSPNGGGGTSSGGGGTSSGGAAGSGGTADCTTDPLKTGIITQQTGISADAFDCQILKYTAQYGEPDAMIFKAIIYVESRFDQFSVACTNNPCGIPSGWSTSETGCFGLMQIVPACGPPPNNLGLLPNGHPNLTQDTSSPDWPGSVFNPDVNVQVGIYGVSDNRKQEKQKFSGCTEDQYTMMAIGDYNSYGSTQSCTVYNSAYDSIVLDAYNQYSDAAGWPKHSY